MPVWLQNMLIGLIIFTLTLGTAIIVQYVVCALALGIAVYQLWNRRARWLWTWMCFIAVGLYVGGVYLALHYQLAVVPLLRRLDLRDRRHRGRGVTAVPEAAAGAGRAGGAG